MHASHITIFPHSHLNSNHNNDNLITLTVRCSTGKFPILPVNHSGSQ